jgi:hypothetical protein
VAWARWRSGTAPARAHPVEWPTLDDTGNVGEIVQEGNTFSAGADLVFGSNSLSAYSYAPAAQATPLKVSRELIQDSAFDLTGLITRLFATRIARIQATHWISGTGVAQPLGLFTGLHPGPVRGEHRHHVRGLDHLHPLGGPGVPVQLPVGLMNDLSLAEIEKIKDGLRLVHLPGPRHEHGDRRERGDPARLPDRHRPGGADAT